MFLPNISRTTKTLWDLIISLSTLGIQTNQAMATSLLHHVLLRQSFMAQAS